MPDPLDGTSEASKKSTVANLLPNSSGGGTSYATPLRIARASPALSDAQRETACRPNPPSASRTPSPNACMLHARASPSNPSYRSSRALRRRRRNLWPARRPDSAEAPRPGKKASVSPRENLSLPVGVGRLLGDVLARRGQVVAALLERLSHQRLRVNRDGLQGRDCLNGLIGHKFINLCRVRHCPGRRVAMSAVGDEWQESVPDTRRGQFGQRRAARRRPRANKSRARSRPFSGLRSCKRPTSQDASELARRSRDIQSLRGKKKIGAPQGHPHRRIRTSKEWRGNEESDFCVTM